MRDPRNPDKWLSTPFERFVFTGKEVWQYKSDTQQIFVYPLGKDEQKRALEEGPLPFLFNMHAKDAENRYQMSLISEDEKAYGVKIVPRLPEDLQSFSVAFVNLDRNGLQPVSISMISPDGKSQKQFQLRKMNRNAKVNEKNFEGKPLGPPWKTIRNPGGGDPPGAGKNLFRNPQGEPAAVRPRANAVER
jgi:TIGR03009 family protein